jgi:hypothetical protein
MKSVLFIRLIFIFSLLVPSISFARFIAIGPIEGTVCSGIIIKSCGRHKLDAVRGDDGQIHSITRTFDDVTEHNGDICHINVKQTQGGIIAWTINQIKQPVFLEKNSNGGFDNLDVDYFTFTCREI